MKRFHDEVSRFVREAKRYAAIAGTQRHKSLGKYRKTDAFDCGHTACAHCHEKHRTNRVRHSTAKRMAAADAAANN